MQPPLEGHKEADVLVVGAGAAGLAAANALKGKGRSVVVLERNICGGSSTGKSAGFLTPDSELELSQLLRRFGPGGARDLWECATRGGELIRAAVAEHGIDCDLQKQDSLFLGIGRSGARDIREEVEARRSLGYGVTHYPEREVPSVVGSRAYSGAVRYAGTYGINALRYAQGMKRALVDAGVEVHEGSEVTSVDGHTVRTHLGSVTAKQIIFCVDKLRPSLSAHAWNTYHAQTFLAISEPLSRTDTERMFPDGPLQCWDSDTIYSYWRLTGSRRLLLGGGSLLTTYARNDTRTERVIGRVVRDFHRRWPQVEGLKFIQFWPGRIDMTRDLLPTLLRDERSPFMHFVLGCVGLPWATFCGDLAARHVLGTADRAEHRYYRYFDINRRFLVPLWAERLVGKRLAFSLNNAWAKYRQVDRGRPPRGGPQDL